MNKATKILHWVVRLIVAVILIQTLFFKFSAAPESVYIFETLGMEPYGRIGTGIIELIASILILIPSKSWMGGILALGTMLGATFFHVSKLGIEVQGDGGVLFGMAILVGILCLISLWLDRTKIPFVKNGLR